MFCQSCSLPHHSLMKKAFWVVSLCMFVLGLSSCGTSSKGGNARAVTGPFDRNGNYVEEWADNPSKWRKAGTAPSPHELKTDVVPQIAKSEQPPENSVPLATSEVKKTVPAISQTVVVSKPPVKKPEPAVVKTATKTTSSSSATKTKAAVTATKVTPKTPVKTSTTAKSKPKTSTTKSKSSASASSSKTKTKPKTTATTSKAKTVPYTVRKGDTLSTIAERMGTSVSAIKKANGMSGSKLKAGGSLKVPK